MSTSPTNPLSRAATPQALRSLGVAEGWSEEAILRAMALASATPDRATWRVYLVRALSSLGVGLVLAGIICFFAFNWDELGKFGKFGLIEAAIAVCAAIGWKWMPRLGGKLALLAGAVLIGPLIVVFGQTYQTGADSYGVFALWAVLTLPWAITARFSPLWLVTMVVTNVALGLYWEQQVDLPEEVGLPLLACLYTLLNGAALVVAELRGHSRWFPRVAVLGAAAPVVFSTCVLIVAPEPRTWSGALSVAMCVGVLAALYGVYRFRRPDTYMLAVAGVAVATIFTTFVGHVLMEVLDVGFFGFLFLGFLVAAEVAALVWWLRRELSGPPSPAAPPPAPPEAS